MPDADDSGEDAATALNNMVLPVHGGHRFWATSRSQL